MFEFDIAQYEEFLCSVKTQRSEELFHRLCNKASEVLSAHYDLRNLEYFQNLRLRMHVLRQVLLLRMGNGIRCSWNARKLREVVRLVSHSMVGNKTETAKERKELDEQKNFVIKLAALRDP